MRHKACDLMSRHSIIEKIRKSMEGNKHRGETSAAPVRLCKGKLKIYIDASIFSAFVLMNA